MTKNPILNALAAIAYIVIVSSAMFYGVDRAGPAEDSIIAPIAMISLFTLSAAVMGYLFVSQPLQLYFDGKKNEAVDLFVRTLGYFAAITVVILLTFLSRMWS